MFQGEKPLRTASPSCGRVEEVLKSKLRLLQEEFKSAADGHGKVKIRH
jgi:hypothetical protein